MVDAFSGTEKLCCVSPIRFDVLAILTNIGNTSIIQYVVWSKSSGIDQNIVDSPYEVEIEVDLSTLAAF